jgi:sterile alpha motif and leucine zipper-containing kinase AZK
LEVLGPAPWKWEVQLQELEFNQLVGAGSYAEVYRGKLRGKQGAITRFRTKHMSPVEHCQFLNEVHVLASLSHPNILHFEAAVATEPHYCIVTEFVTPGSLQVVLKLSEEYPLPWPQPVSMASDVAQGMAYLHSFHPPIVHRDLKPSNLLVDSTGSVQVCDFGTSRQVVPTGTMSVCGTPVYMAPEVLRGDRYDERADLYSFGIVLWELLVRELPFKGVIPVVAGMKIAYEGARPPVPAVETMIEPGQPQYLKLIQDCWAQQATERPMFNQVVTMLQEIIDLVPKCND